MTGAAQVTQAVSAMRKPRATPRHPARDRLDAGLWLHERGSFTSEAVTR